MKTLETNARSTVVQAVDEVVARYGLADTVRALAELANRGNHLGGESLHLAKGDIVARRLLAVSTLARVAPTACLSSIGRTAMVSQRPLENVNRQLELAAGHFAAGRLSIAKDCSLRVIESVEAVGRRG